MLSILLGEGVLDVDGAPHVLDASYRRYCGGVGKGEILALL